MELSTAEQTFGVVSLTVLLNGAFVGVHRNEGKRKPAYSKAFTFDSCGILSRENSIATKCALRVLLLTPTDKVRLLLTYNFAWKRKFRLRFSKQTSQSEILSSKILLLRTTSRFHVTANRKQALIFRFNKSVVIM
uniref:Uncharacterized protein n=2 Tax=Bombyx mori TaxID=7091 RepID=A0A8R2HPX7_BOMMO|nr:uncharacterized protein LOC110385800 [Bombyx mori]